MTNTLHLMSIFVIAGILIGSVSISSSVFATYDKNEHHENGGQSSSNANLYVNSLSFNYENTTSLDSCDLITPPCILINPFDPDNHDDVFIADPALLNTRTLIAVNVYEQNNFPTDIDDIVNFPECTTVTLANINGINGIYIECNSIDAGIIDVTYSFTDPMDDDVQDDNHDGNHNDRDDHDDYNDHDYDDDYDNDDHDDNHYDKYKNDNKYKD